jgi:hypothetical protein
MVKSTTSSFVWGSWACVDTKNNQYQTKLTHFSAHKTFKVVHVVCCLKTRKQEQVASFVQDGSGVVRCCVLFEV